MIENKSLVQNSNEQEVVDRYNMRAPDFLAQKKSPRWSALDMARGFAIILMILSHCVKGVMAHGRIPDWGMVPVHLMTKFSSSLFILVFGVSLSIYFLPHIKKKTWRTKRWWMIKRGIELMFWYKVLTVVQMFQYYPKKMIMETLWFKRMPDFVEILSFYAIALVWLPFFLPLWNRMGWVTKAITIAGTFMLGQWLHYNFDFWEVDTLKALLVEKKGYYTFGQFQRGALIFLGLYIGDIYSLHKQRRSQNRVVPLGILALGLFGLSYFFFSNWGELEKTFWKVAKNVGKHPFDVDFFCFSLGGALSVLGLCLLMNQKMRKFLKPVSYIGRHSLNAFILHIVIIFYFYRYYFGLHYKVTYMQSLGLTGLCVLSIMFTLFTWEKVKKVIKK